MSAKKIDPDMVRQWHSDGKSVEQMAVQAGCNPFTIRKVINRLGLPVARRPNNKKPVDERLLRRLWADEVPVARIGQIMNLSETSVRNAAASLGLVPYLRQRQRPIVRLDQPKDEQKPSKVAPPVATPVGLIGDLIASKGQWRHLSAIAVKHGLTMTKVQQEYHRARAAR